MFVACQMNLDVFKKDMPDLMECKLFMVFAAYMCLLLLQTTALLLLTVALAVTIVIFIIVCIIQRAHKIKVQRFMQRQDLKVKRRVLKTFVNNQFSAVAQRTLEGKWLNTDCSKLVVSFLRS